MADEPVNIKPYLEVIENAVGGEQVRDAIINCMQEINKDSAFKIQSKLISGKISDKGHGTYTAPSGVLWKNVTLDITTDDGSEVPVTTQAYDFTVNMSTESRTYDAEEEHGKGARWGNIIVDLDFSSAYDNLNVIDNIVISTNDLDDTATWHAEASGYDSVRSVTFSNVDPIKERGGYIGEGGTTYYKITFKDPDTGNTYGVKDYVSGTQGYDWVDDNGRHPTKVGQSFTGWTGNGMVDMSKTVYAQFGDGSIVIGELTPDWRDIAKNGGKGIQTGKYKSIRVDTEIEYALEANLFPNAGLPETGKYSYQLEAIMMKVSDGESGSNTSWLSMQPLTNQGNGLVPSHISSIQPQQGQGVQYNESPSTTWLNYIFLNYIIPSEIRPYIKQVTKYFKMVSNLGTLTNQPIQQKIWVPSTKELWIAGYDETHWNYPGDPTESQRTSEYYTNAQGPNYMNGLVQDGIARKNIFELLAPVPSQSNLYWTLRDSARNSNNNIMKTLFLGTDSASNDTTWLDSGIASAAHIVRPCLFGFCL